jgi:hypothetical protein
MKQLSHHRLLELLAYDSQTGVFLRRRSQKPVATIQKNGRVQVCIDYVIFRAHRLAWFYVHGVWPAGDIDHIDGNPANNAIANLRCVTRSVNMENQRRARADNKLGVMGVSQRGHNKFRATIVVSGKVQRLGNFSNPEAAHAAYRAAKRRLHVGCTI